MRPVRTRPRPPEPDYFRAGRPPRKRIANLRGETYATNPGRLVLLEVYEPDPDDDSHYTTVLQDVQRVIKRFPRCTVVADQREGAHQAEVLSRELKDVFDAIALAASELSVDRGSSMEVLATDGQAARTPGTAGMGGPTYRFR